MSDCIFLNRKPFAHSADVQQGLRERLNPARFRAMSQKMAAIVGYVIGERFVRPPIHELVVMHDGEVFARVGDRVGCDVRIGSYDDLLQNWQDLIDAAQLTFDEWAEVACRFAAKVGFYRRLTA